MCVCSKFSGVLYCCRQYVNIYLAASIACTALIVAANPNYLFCLARSAEAASPHLGLFDEFSHLTQLETHRCLLCALLSFPFDLRQKSIPHNDPFPNLAARADQREMNLNLPNGFFFAYSSLGYDFLFFILTLQSPVLIRIIHNYNVRWYVDPRAALVPVWILDYFGARDFGDDVPRS